VWKVSVGGIATFGMGTATSPILHGNLLILQCDEDTGEKSFIVAFDAKTGKEVWRTPRKVQASWATPVVVSTGGHEELVTSGNEFVIAYDPATGRELWRTEGVKSNAIATPVVGHGLVIASAGFPRKRVIAIRPGGSGDITGTDSIAWTYEKGTAYVSSPILYGDYIYLTNDQGILTCLDAKTGKVVYEGGRVPAPAMFFASMVAYDGMLLQSSEDGDMFLVKAGPTHEVIRTNSIGEPLYASPAIANGRLYVRGLNHVFAFGGPR
jgi:outer membrane protein assembly factor BamB